VAGFFAVSALLVPGFGAVDLSVSWDLYWQPVIAGTWGVFFSLLVAFPFLVIACRPAASPGAVWTLLIASASMLVSAVVSLELQLAGLLLWFGLGVAVVALPSRASWWPLVLQPHRTAALVAVVSSTPWLAYAWHMASRNRQGHPADISSGVDHYSVIAALAVALAALAVLTTLSPVGRRQIGTNVGVCAAYLGALSYNWPNITASLGRTGGIAAIVWALLLAVWAWLPARTPEVQTALE
jgi:hypothetical protein